MAQKHAESITQLIYRILHAQGSRMMGTGQLSSRYCNRGPVRSGCPEAEAETPDRSMQRTDEGEISFSRSFMYRGPINCSPSYRCLDFRRISAFTPSALCFSSSPLVCPLNGNAILIKRAPETAVIDSCDIRSLWLRRIASGDGSSSTGVLWLCGLAWPIAHSLSSASPQRLSGTMAALPKSKCVSWRNGVLSGKIIVRANYELIPTPSGSALVMFTQHLRCHGPTILPLPWLRDATSHLVNLQRKLSEGALYPLLLLLQPAAAWADQPHRHLAAAISVNWICAGVCLDRSTASVKRCWLLRGTPHGREIAVSQRLKSERPIRTIDHRRTTGARIATGS